MSDSETEDVISSEIRTKTLYRKLTYTFFAIFVAILILYVLGAIDGYRVFYGLIISGGVGFVFTYLNAKKNSW